jgi:hypothetical protein
MARCARVSISALVASVVLAAATGCDFFKSKKSPPAPAPSASVVTIVNALGACEDIPTCDRLCDAGTGDQCRRLGMAYQFGNTVPQDEARATELFDKACALNNPFGCVSAGQSYEYHHGVPKDDAKAASFYKRACDMGYVGGCLNYGIMLENGRGVPADLDAAANYYEQGCRDGIKVGCEHRERMRARDAAAE